MHPFKRDHIPSLDWRLADSRLGTSLCTAEERQWFRREKGMKRHAKVLVLLFCKAVLKKNKQRTKLHILCFATG